MRLHPTVEAFWYPIAYAIPGGLFGVAVGWILAGLDKPYGFQSGLMLGAMTAWGTWIVLAFFWLMVLWRSMDQHSTVEPIKHITDAEAADAAFDPAWIEIKCFASPQDKHILHDLPIEFSDLFVYATGIMRNNKTTVYSEWVGSKAAGKLFSYQEDYETLIAWFGRWGYGALNKRNTLELSEKGKDLLEDCLHQDFSNLYPTEVEDRARIHIPQLTRLRS